MIINNPAPVIKLLGTSATSVSHTGNTNETVLATVTIPAGMMGLNGILRISSDWQVPNNSNTKTMRTRLGGLAGLAAFNQVSTTVVSISDNSRLIYNRGAANSQVVRFGSSQGGGTTGAVTTGAIDTSVTQTLVFTAQCGDAADTITLHAYLVELILP